MIMWCKLQMYLGVAAFVVWTSWLVDFHVYFFFYLVIPWATVCLVLCLLRQYDQTQTDLLRFLYFLFNTFSFYRCLSWILKF